MAAHCWQIHSRDVPKVRERQWRRRSTSQETPSSALAACPVASSHESCQSNRQHVWVSWHLSLCGGGPSYGVLWCNQIVITHQRHEQPLSLSAAKAAIKSWKGIPKGTNTHLTELA